MKLYGPDVSSWKPVEDAHATKRAGNSFLISKVTGGLSYENPLYADQIAKARDADLVVGHFHFLHETDSDPEPVQENYVSDARMDAEAQHFLKYLDWRPGEPVMVDVEDKRVKVEQSLAVLRFCRGVERALRIKPLIYTYPYYRDDYLTNPLLAEFPLWWADYDRMYDPHPWPRYTLLQYTAEATVPGIATTRVDMNEFPGTLEEFKALGTPEQSARPTVVGGLYHYLGGIWLRAS